MKLFNFLIRNKPKAGEIYQLRTIKDYFCMVTKVEDGMVSFAYLYQNPFRTLLNIKIKYYLSPSDTNNKHSIFDFCSIHYEKVPDWSENVYTRQDIFNELDASKTTVPSSSRW